MHLSDLGGVSQPARSFPRPSATNTLGHDSNLQPVPVRNIFLPDREMGKVLNTEIAGVACSWRLQLIRLCRFDEQKPNQPSSQHRSCEISHYDCQNVGGGTAMRMVSSLMRTDALRCGTVLGTVLRSSPNRQRSQPVTAYGDPSHSESTRRASNQDHDLCPGGFAILYSFLHFARSADASSGGLYAERRREQHAMGRHAQHN